jgi:hypothetical protein
LLRITLRQLQQGCALQHLHVLLWFVIAFGARRNAQATRLSAEVLGLPSRRAGHGAPVPGARPAPMHRPALPAPVRVSFSPRGFPSCCISLRYGAHPG